MKKVVLIILIGMLIIPFSTMAQLQVKPAFGINFSNIKDDNDAWALDGKTGYQIGGTVAIGTKFIFEPGVFWQRDNFEAKSAEGTARDVFAGHYNSFKIPVYLGYYIVGDSQSTLGIKVFGGPSAKFTLGAGSDEVAGIEELEKDDIKNAIWGVKAGAGVEVLSFFVELGYNWGVSDVFSGDRFNDLESQTNHFEIMFGMKF